MRTIRPSDGGAPEKQVVSDIMLFLSLNGWLVHRIEQRIGFCSGTPDMIAGKAGRAIWIEAKRRAGPWRNPRGQVQRLQAGQQKPGQRRFMLKWNETIPYIVARAWEDVYRAIMELHYDQP